MRNELFKYKRFKGRGNRLFRDRTVWVTEFIGRRFKAEENRFFLW